jgi:asparagine synthase (glutamine-hydrolysing)
MCGITGFWQKDAAHASSIAGRMAQKMKNRGPGDVGVRVDSSCGIAAAHRRLSILDLSTLGHQPMMSPCKRYVLIYNGEIYNHLELRTELENVGGHFDWRGHSDTETLLALIRHWDIEGAITRLNGMFAFALWDTRELNRPGFTGDSIS